MWISLLSHLVLGITLAYLLMMLLITLGWLRLKSPDCSNDLIAVSVVVAARDEQEFIGELLESLAKQNYPENLFEVIVVNDHSTDNTEKIVKNFANNHKNCNILLKNATDQGKKAALRQAIALAQGKIIVATDADCTMSEKWLSTMIQPFCNNTTMLVMAPVIYQKRKGVLNNFYSLEFMSLVASGAGATGLGIPFMGNGANMAFRRQVFEEAVNEADYFRYTSGDDVFLIHQSIKKYGRKSVCFLREKEVLVETIPPASLSAFIGQRLRWGSKAKGYKLSAAIAVAIVVLIMNIALVVSVLAGFFKPWIWLVFLLLMLTKMLADYPLINRFARFSGRSNTMFYFLPFSLIYPFYLTFTGLTSFFVNFTWKGRKYSK